MSETKKFLIYRDDTSLTAPFLSFLTTMRSGRIGKCVCLIVLISTSALGQVIGPYPHELTQRNPDGWFTLSVPRAMARVERHADVAGGFYISDILEIHYDYWTNENTPNWLQGRYATSLLLACSAKSKNSRTIRTRIDGKTAIIQQCSETDERKGFRYIYYVTFPKLRVFDGETFHYGMFNLMVEYRSRSYLWIAKRIVSSLDFGAKHQKVSPNSF